MEALLDAPLGAQSHFTINNFSFWFRGKETFGWGHFPSQALIPTVMPCHRIESNFSLVRCLQG